MAKRGAGRDEFGNLQGKQFDLGGEDDTRLQGEKVLLCAAYSGENYYNNARDLLIPTLARRHLILEVVTVPEFNQILDGNQLDTYSQLWYLSDMTAYLTQSAIDRIVQFNKAGNGILIWADNDPYYADANLLAQALCGSSFNGNKNADRLMIPGARLEPGIFIEHQLTFGLNSLYEGITICDIVPGEGVEIIAQSHDGQRCMGAYDRDGQRVVLDTGFTKIHSREAYFQTAGTARYFNNVAFWLARAARGTHYKLLTGAENMAVIRQGEVSETFGYQLQETAALRYVLAWDGSETVGLDVIAPDGTVVESAQGTESPMEIVIPDAQVGMWGCRIRGVLVSRAELEYVLTVVREKAVSAAAVPSPRKAPDQPPVRRPFPAVASDAPRIPQFVMPGEVDKQWMLYVLLDCSIAASRLTAETAKGIAALVAHLRAAKVQGVIPALAFGECRVTQASIGTPYPLNQIQKAKLNLAISGETALAPILQLLLNELNQARPSHLLSKPLVVIALAGEPTDTYVVLAESLQAIMARREVTVIAVGLDASVADSTLRRISRLALRVDGTDSEQMAACFTWIAEVAVIMMTVVRTPSTEHTINLPPLPAGVVRAE